MRHQLVDVVDPSTSPRLGGGCFLLCAQSFGWGGKGDTLRGFGDTLQTLAKGRVIDNFEAAVEVFDECGVGLDPIP